MDADINVFASNLRYLREASGLSLRDVAVHTGISKSLLHKYETGKSDPTLKKIKVLANYFNADINWLVGESESKRLKKDA